MPFVEKAFRENELAIVALMLGAGNVPVMVYSQFIAVVKTTYLLYAV